MNDTVVEPGSITGQVLDVDGAPATNFPVYAEPVEAAGEWARTYTDETGRYAFHGLWPGEYRLAFQTPEGLRQYAPQKLTVADAGRFTVGPGDAPVVDEQTCHTAGSPAG